MKKGFTLVELLGVLIVLALVALIAIPSIINVIRDSRESTYKQQLKTITNLAERWETENSYEVDKAIDTNGYFYVSIQRLKEDGYLKSDDVIDARTNTTITGGIAILNDSANNQYTYEYTGENLVSSSINYNFASSVSSSDFTRSQISTSDTVSKYATLVTRNSATAASWNGFYSYPITTTNLLNKILDKDITISFVAKANTTLTLTYCGLENSTVHKSITFSTNWQKYVITGKITNSNWLNVSHALVFYYWSSLNASLYLSDIKLETGTEATVYAG